jgi:hypothetical protein
MMIFMLAWPLVAVTAFLGESAPAYQLLASPERRYKGAAASDRNAV